MVSYSPLGKGRWLSAEIHVVNGAARLGPLTSAAAVVVVGSLVMCLAAAVDLLRSLGQTEWRQPCVFCSSARASHRFLLLFSRFPVLTVVVIAGQMKRFPVLMPSSQVLMELSTSAEMGRWPYT